MSFLARRPFPFFAAALAWSVAASAAPPAPAHATDAATVTAGDLDDQDYWWARFDARMLEDAVRTHQPEGRVAVDLASSIRRLDELAARYPRHAEIARWRARAKEVAARLDPNALRNVAYGPGCLWGEANYAQAWVNWHWGRMELDAGNRQGRGLVAHALRNLDLLSAPGRMDHYPAEARQWVVDTRQAAQRLLDETKRPAPKPARRATNPKAR